MNTHRRPQPASHPWKDKDYTTRRKLTRAWQAASVRSRQKNKIKSP